MNQKNLFYSKNAPKPMGLYPHARKVGNLIFLSGIGSREPGTDLIPESFEAECHSVFKNVRTVLEEAGSSWEKIIDVTVFLTNMKKDFPVYNKIYAEYFKTNPPCRTTVEVGSLPSPISIELKCIAEVE